MTQTQHPPRAQVRMGENQYGKADVRLFKVFRDQRATRSRTCGSRP